MPLHLEGAVEKPLQLSRETISSCAAVCGLSIFWL